MRVGWRIRDALHRQINIHIHSGLLFRKKEQTALEGSRRASVRHWSGRGVATGSGRKVALLPVEGPISIRRRVQEQEHPPAGRLQEFLALAHSRAVQSWRASALTLSLRGLGVSATVGQPVIA